MQVKVKNILDHNKELGTINILESDLPRDGDRLRFNGPNGLVDAFVKGVIWDYTSNNNSLASVILEVEMWGI